MPESMSPDELAAIRKRDERAQVTNAIGALVPCAQDRRLLLAEVDRLTDERDTFEALATENGRLATEAERERDRWRKRALRAEARTVRTAPLGGAS